MTESTSRIAAETRSSGSIKSSECDHNKNEPQFFDRYKVTEITNTLKKNNLRLWDLSSHRVTQSDINPLISTEQSKTHCAAMAKKLKGKPLNESEMHSKVFNWQVKLTQREELLTERESEVSKREELLTERESEVSQRTSNLNAKNLAFNQGKISLQAAFVLQKTKLQEELERQQTKLQEAVHQKCLKLEGVIVQLTQAKAKLTQKKAKLSRKSAELNRKETELNRKETELNRKETKLTQKKAELTQKSRRASSHKRKASTNEITVRSKRKCSDSDWND